MMTPQTVGLQESRRLAVYFVGEVFSDGHACLDDTQLEAVKLMANRTGFSVLDPMEYIAPLVHRIKLHVVMENPYFTARLEERPPRPEEFCPKRAPALPWPVHRLSEVLGRGSA